MRARCFIAISTGQNIANVAPLLTEADIGAPFTQLPQTYPWLGELDA